MTDTTTIIDQYNAAFLERAPEKLVDLIADKLDDTPAKKTASTR